MNHKPLTPDHGYPVRAVVPGKKRVNDNNEYVVQTMHPFI